MSHWIHNLSPFAIEFAPGVGIRWYGLAYLAGLALGWWMVTRWVRQGRSPLRAEQIQDYVLCIGIGMLVGGRLGYCLFYQGDRLLTDPLYLLKVWEGGMASHGGIIGMAVGAWWYARSRAQSLPALADLVAATAPMGVFLGRIANFINGELWGMPSTVPWAVIFPDAPLVDGVNVPRHPSQLYAAFGEGLFLLALILPIHASHRRPGLTAGILVAAYGVVRCITEIWRMPDVGQPVYWGMVSKGQLFSLPFIAIGIAIAIWAWRRGPRPGAYLAGAD